MYIPSVGIMEELMNKLFNKDFTLVVLGQIISLFGNAILRFALPLYLLKETGSAAIFGIVTASSFLPMIFLSFLGGILADRVNKRNIMVVLDFFTALVIFALSISLGRLPIVPLLIISLMLLYGISGTYQPTVQASIPALVSSDKILSASAIVNQVNALASLLGPVVGGMLYGTFGIMPILIISMVCFLISAIMEIFIKIPFEKRKSEKILTIIKNDFKDSINYMRIEKPLLMKVVAFIALFNLILTSIIIIGIPVIIVNTLKLSDELLGLSQGIFALGGLIGGIVTAMLGARLKMKNSFILLVTCSLCVGIIALPLLCNAPTMITYWILTGSCFVFMASASIFSIQMVATIQKETPSELIGKIIALAMAISMCAQPIGQAMYGIIFENFSANIAEILLIVTVISFLISIVTKRLFSQIE